MKSNPSSLSDFSFIAIWTLDNELKLITANSKAIDISNDPFKGLNEKDEKELKKYITGETKNHPEGLSLQWISNSDEIFWYKWLAHKEENGYFLTVTDVSEIKNSEYTLSQILDAIPDPILVKRESSHIVWANRAFRDYYDLTNKELAEMIDAPFAEPDYTKQYILDDKKVWETGKPLLVEREPVVRFDGVTRDFQTLKCPIFDLHNKVKFTVGISQDITEKVINEEKAISAAKLAAIGEMSGGMAHEINNPIAVIAGKVFLLKRILHKQDEVNKELILNYLDTIEAHVERISNIINVLRRFSLTDDFEDFKNVNLMSVLAQTLLLCETRIKEKGISLTVQIPDNLMVDLRSIQFARAVLNLINNAADAVENTQVQWIKILAEAKDENLILQVADSGPGVPLEIEGRIMLPFYTTKDVGKGSGLGLSFALSVAKNHGGSLMLAKGDSRSCFEMKIPLKQVL